MRLGRVLGFDSLQNRLLRFSLEMFHPLAPSKVLDFLGRLCLAAVFVNALPGKFSNFSDTAASIAAKGVAEPLAGVLLVAAIVMLIAGSLLLVFGTNTRLGASLLLVFLVPPMIPQDALLEAHHVMEQGQLQ